MKKLITATLLMTSTALSGYAAEKDTKEDSYNLGDLFGNTANSTTKNQTEVTNSSTFLEMDSDEEDSKKQTTPQKKVTSTPTGKIDDKKDIQNITKKAIDTFDFTKPPSSEYTLTGFSGTESPNGTWTDGNLASFSYDISNFLVKPKTLTINFTPFCYNNHSQKVSFTINGSQSTELQFKEMAGQAIPLGIPNSITGKVKLDIKLPDAISPKAVKLNEDTRTLGIFVTSIKFS